MTDNNIIPTEPEPMKEVFSYSDEQLRMVDKPLDRYPSRGPLVILNRAGECPFSLQDDNYDAWSNIMEGKDDCLSSRPILLPRELSGLIVCVSLSKASRMKFPNQFKIGLGALHIKENERINMPVAIHMQLNTISEEEVSENYKFVIKNLGWNSTPKSCIALFENTFRDKLPHIVLKFSN